MLSLKELLTKSSSFRVYPSCIQLNWPLCRTARGSPLQTAGAGFSRPLQQTCPSSRLLFLQRMPLEWESAAHRHPPAREPPASCQCQAPRRTGYPYDTTDYKTLYKAVHRRSVGVYSVVGQKTMPEEKLCNSALQMETNTSIASLSRCYVHVPVLQLDI